MNKLKQWWEDRSYPLWFVMVRISFHQVWVNDGPLWWTCRYCREQRRT